MKEEEIINKIKEIMKEFKRKYPEYIIYGDEIKVIQGLLELYNKEKEKNSKAIGHIESCKTSLGNYILSPNETEYLLKILKEE